MQALVAIAATFDTEVLREFGEGAGTFNAQELEVGIKLLNSIHDGGAYAIVISNDVSA